MEHFDLLNLPSCHGIEHHWSVDKPAYYIAEYALCAKNSEPWSVALLRRMTAVRKVITTEGQPFYATDVFGEIDGLGGLMNGLDIAHIIVATGNTRNQFIDFGGGYGKTVKIKEWKLAYPMADLWDAYNEVKQFIIDQL
jgi:hypothetical protein